MGIRILVITTVALCMIAVPQFVQAQVYYGEQEQKVEISPFIGYMVNTNTTVAYGYIENDDGVAYGASIGIDVRRGGQVELLWVMQSSHSSYQSQSWQYSSFDFDVVFNYFMIGYVHELNPRAKVRPFFRAGAGAWWASPDYQGLSDTWRVAMDLAGGVKIYPSEKIGIRLQAAMMMPLVVYGGGLYVGTGGASVGVSAGIPIAQFNFSAGLIIVL
jgi:hypothetical protein